MIRPLADTERIEIERAIAACGNDKTKAASRLQISRSTLYRKLEEYRVQDDAAVKRPLRFHGPINSQNGAQSLTHS